MSELFLLRHRLCVNIVCLVLYGWWFHAVLSAPEPSDALAWSGVAIALAVLVDECWAVSRLLGIKIEKEKRK